MRIRDFEKGDYDALVRVHGEQGIVWPEWPANAESWAAADSRRNPKLRYRRWVAEEGGVVIAFANYGQSDDDYHPQRFYVNVEVSPERRRMGIGSALYDVVMDALASFDPRVLRANAFENLPQGYDFLERRGFSEVFRETPVHLELAAFDVRVASGAEASLRERGIWIRTLRELESDPERDRKLYRLYWACNADAPTEGGDFETPLFEEWVEWGLRDPSIPPDAYFVAGKGDEYIGLRELSTGSPGILLGGLMGVDRRYRGLGIANALQRKSVDYARENGFACIKSCTAKANVRMQALFDAFGFKRDPEWRQCERRL